MLYVRRTIPTYGRRNSRAPHSNIQPDEPKYRIQSEFPHCWRLHTGAHPMLDHLIPTEVANAHRLLFPRWYPKQWIRGRQCRGTSGHSVRAPYPSIHSRY